MYNQLSRNTKTPTRMAANRFTANPRGDSKVDIEALMKMLKTLYDGDGSDWNQGILRPDLSQECSEVETNPPSPDVAVYPCSGTEQTGSGQNQHVMSVLTSLPQQAPASTGDVPDSDVIATRQPKLQPATSAITYTSTEQASQSARTDTTLTTNQSTTMQQDNNGQQATKTSTLMTARLRRALISTAPVIDADDSNDIHNISVADLLPFHAYTDESMSVEQMIVENVADHLPVPAGSDDRRILKTVHHTQTSPQTMDQAKSSQTSPPTQCPTQQYPQVAEADTSVYDTGPSAVPVYPQMTESFSNQTYACTAVESAEGLDLLSLLGTTSLPKPTASTSSDVSNTTAVSAAADPTTCITSLTTGGAYLEPAALSIASLVGDDMTPQPETQKAAEEALDTGSVSPLVKEELKSKIQLGRLRRGEKELRVSFENKPTGEPSEEEKEKINRRKEMNRKSANQSRLNRQNRVKGLKQFIAKSEKENGDLMVEIEQLNEELKCLRRKLGDYTAP